MTGTLTLSLLNKDDILVEGDTYLLDGAQVPLVTRTETIEVAGGDPVEITVRETVDGPIISDVAGIDTYVAVGADAPVPAPGSTATRAAPPPRGDGYAVALRWTALVPGRTFEALDALEKAVRPERPSVSGRFEFWGARASS